MMIKALLDAYQEKRGIKLRELSRETGVQYLALRRWKMGLTLNEKNFGDLMKWVLSGEPKEPIVPHGTQQS